MSKLIIENIEDLKSFVWDKKNYVEDSKEYSDKYVISVWRGWRRHFVELKKVKESNGYYSIGVIDDNHSIPKPYWIKPEHVKDTDTFKKKLKKLTNYWKTKLI